MTDRPTTTMRVPARELRAGDQLDNHDQRVVTDVRIINGGDTVRLEVVDGRDRRDVTDVWAMATFVVTR